jgi:folylpolyglutamate synthase/dihydropteroate synthase
VALADAAYATRNESERAGDPTPITQAFLAADTPVAEHASVREALGAARAAAGDDDLICVTGSLYTVADARRALGVTV